MSIHRDRAPWHRSATTLALALLVATCGDPTEPIPPAQADRLITQLPRSLSADERAVADASNRFGLGLLAAIRARQPESANTFLSPLSASMALGMAMNGANGPTWTQMRDALGFGDLDEPAINRSYRSLTALLLDLDPAIELGIGNALWVREGVTLLPGFLERTTTYFDATVDPLDFMDPASVDVMNAWVDSATNGRIAELLSEANPDALLYLINAIYFNAGWRDTFDPALTEPRPFTRADGSTVTVDMMSGEVEHRSLYYVTDAGEFIRGVEMPYAGGTFAAVAILPPWEQSIDELVAGLDAETWAEWMDQLDAQQPGEEADGGGDVVELPKFELEWGDSLKPALSDLGMIDAFSYPPADFTRITDIRDDLYISAVVQKTYVRVDEEGTEAAAATAVEVTFVSGPATITFDRPFLFAIRERLSGTILFLGVIGDPTE